MKLDIVSIKAAVKNNDLAAIETLLNVEESPSESTRFLNLMKLLQEETELCLAVLLKVFSDKNLSNKCFRFCWFNEDAPLLYRLYGLIRLTATQTYRTSFPVYTLSIIVKDQDLINLFMFDLLHDVRTNDEAFIKFFKGYLDTIAIIQQVFFVDGLEKNHPRIISHAILERIFYRTDIFWALIQSVNDLSEFCSVYEKVKEFTDDSDGIFNENNNYAAMAVKRVLMNDEKLGKLKSRDKFEFRELLIRYGIADRTIINSENDRFIAATRRKYEVESHDVSIRNNSLFTKIKSNHLSKDKTHATMREVSKLKAGPH